MNQSYFEPDPFNPKAYENITPRVVQANELKQTAKNKSLYIFIGISVVAVVTYVLYVKYKDLEEQQRNYKN